MLRSAIFYKGIAPVVVVAGLLFAVRGPIFSMLGMAKQAMEESEAGDSDDPDIGSGANDADPNPASNSTPENSSVQNPNHPSGAQTNDPYQNSRQPFQEDKLTIGTFNIKVLGKSKMRKPDVVQRIAHVARHFDILAIQELRSVEQWVIPELVKIVNDEGKYQFNYIVGPRQGRTNSTEQYVYLFDTNRVELIAQPFVVDDPEDEIHREPMVAWFRYRGLPANQSFSFALVNIHTDPDETKDELNGLANAYRFVRKKIPYEDDIIVLGDFNESPNDFFNFGRLPNINAAIPAYIKTNTARTKCYDNIVFDANATREFTNKAAVFDLEKEFGITRTEAQQISDHLPVWAQFSVFEKTRTDVAGRPNLPVR